MSSKMTKEGSQSCQSGYISGYPKMQKINETLRIMEYIKVNVTKESKKVSRCTKYILLFLKINRLFLSFIKVHLLLLGVTEFTLCAHIKIKIDTRIM